MQKRAQVEPVMHSGHTKPSYASTQSGAKIRTWAAETKSGALPPRSTAVQCARGCANPLDNNGIVRGIARIGTGNPFCQLR